VLALHCGNETNEKTDHYRTDPGQDDAVAILLALASTEEIAVSASLPWPVMSARPERKKRPKSGRLSGRTTTPIYAGCKRPIRAQNLSPPKLVHGESGLDGPKLPDPTNRNPAAARRSTSSSSG